MNLYGLLDTMISKLNKSVKAEPQTLTDAEKSLVRDNIDAANKQEFPNPNLLDNWYFGNPINQRGQTSYNNFDYTIDRYRIWDSQGTVTVENGYLAINNNTEGTMTFVQHFEEDRMKSLLGKTLTQSVFLEDGSLYSHTFTVPDCMTDFFPHIYFKDGTYMYFAIFGIAQSYQPIRFLIGSGKSLNVKAVKLEYGTTQTLAHQDSNGNWVLNEIPNYTEELLKCQRYYYRLQSEQTPAIYGLWTANVADHAQIMITIPQKFRVVPTVTISDNVVIAYNTQTSSSPSASGAWFISMAENVIWLRCYIGGIQATDSGYLAGISPSAYVEFSADL